MQLLDLYAGRAFRMGKGSNWRIVHPEMGARRLTLNHGLHEPDQEFTQHLHDESEDMIVVLEGGGALRQGDTYTPIEAGEGIFVPVGEVHGTVNDSGAPARLISFQAPPDPALYAGKPRSWCRQFPAAARRPPQRGTHPHPRQGRSRARPTRRLALRGLRGTGRAPPRPRPYPPAGARGSVPHGDLR